MFICYLKISLGSTAWLEFGNNYLHCSYMSNVFKLALVSVIWRNELGAKTRLMKRCCVKAAMEGTMSPDTVR